MSETRTIHDATITDIGRHDGQTVRIKGWLTNRRSSGKIHFLQLRDGTGVIQAVMGKNDVTPEAFGEADHLGQETSLIVTGTVRSDTRAPGGYELSVQRLEVVTLTEDYPITPKEHGVDFLMDHRHLWLRSARQQAILRVRAEIIRAVTDFLDGHGFLRVDAPILTPNACEGTTTLFETDYFDQKAYLTQSGQLYMEAAALAFGKVYCFGPTFRAEKSKTRRHLTEFWMVEPEMAYCDLDQDMAVQEEFITFIVGRVLARRAADLAALERDTTKLAKIKPPFPRLSYDDAVALLKDAGLPFEWGGDFGAPDETEIASRYDIPVFVHRFPAKIKAFYMKADPQRPELALGADLLAPEGYGEIIGGGQREENLAVLEQRLADHGLPREAFGWYLDLRKYGSVPHAGFGLGIERTVSWLCGLEHVRETIPFPRMLSRLTP